MYLYIYICIYIYIYIYIYIGEFLSLTQAGKEGIFMYVDRSLYETVHFWKEPTAPITVADSIALADVPGRYIYIYIYMYIYINKCMYFYMYIYVYIYRMYIYVRVYTYFYILYVYIYAPIAVADRIALADVPHIHV
jgi:hypothetical protein